MKPGGEREDSLWTEYIYKQIEEEEGELAGSGEDGKMLLVWWGFFFLLASFCRFHVHIFLPHVIPEKLQMGLHSWATDDNHSGYCCYLWIKWGCFLCTTIRDWISETKQQWERETARPPFSVFECHDLFTKQAAVFAFIIHVTVTQAERNNDGKQRRRFNLRGC